MLLKMATWGQRMPKEEKNQADVCFDTFLSMDLGEYEDQWLLLVNGKCVYSDLNEDAVINYANENFPRRLRCIVKVPTNKPFYA